MGEIAAELYCERAVVPRFMRGIQRGCFVVGAINRAGFRGQAAERRPARNNFRRVMYKDMGLGGLRISLIINEMRNPYSNDVDHASLT